MADSVHPYSQWLSLPVELTEPNHYQLLGLRDFESDEESIAIAADRAMAKVRGFRPGVHAKAWSQLLDELYGAKSCLLDAASRAEYDRGLRGSRNGTSQSAAINPAKADRLPPASINPDRLPPGMGPSQRGSKNDSSAAGAKLPQESVDSNQVALPQVELPQPVQPQPTSPAEERPTAMPTAGAVAAASSAPSASATSPSPAPTPAAPVPVAYPVYPQMAGYAPHAGYASPNGYAPPYGYPPESVPGAGYAPMAMPYAVPPSPTPPTVAHVGHPAASAYAGSIDPMAPVAIPGVTPAGAIPVGTAVAMGATSPMAIGSASGISSGMGPAALSGLPDETAKVGASASTLAKRNARRAEQAKQNLMFIAGAAGLALLAAGGIYFGMFGPGGSSTAPTTVAQHVPTRDSDAPAPLGRTLESELPGGTPRRVESQSQDTTPPVSTVPSAEQQPAEPNPVAPGPAPTNPESPGPANPGTVTQLPEMTAPAGANPPAIPAPMPMPQPEVPLPETTPIPTPAAAPTPDPVPAAPAPPVPAPVPENPMPASPQQLAALAEALTMGRTALTEQNFEEADKFIAQAAELALADEHQLMVARLRDVGNYVKQFRAAVEAGAKSLETKELQVGTSAFVSFVEVLPDRVIVRTAGQNRNYPYAELPPGLAQAIVDQQLDGSDPTSRVVKGAYYAVARGDRKTLLEKAQTWWEEAQLGGVDTSHLMPFLTDDYENLKSADAGNAGSPATAPASE
jgi:hypothetical protein